jgi:hypothetical protein
MQTHLPLNAADLFLPVELLVKLAHARSANARGCKCALQLLLAHFARAECTRDVAEALLLVLGYTLFSLIPCFFARVEVDVWEIKI